MKIRNRRGSAVTIAPAQGPRIHVEAGESVDVPDDLAEQLLAQPDRWEAVSEPKSTKKAAKSGEEA